MRASISFAALAFTLGLSAQSRAEDPKPPAQLQQVKGLIGKWSGKGTMLSEGKTYPIAMTWDCVDASGGFGVKCSAKITGLPGFTYTFDDLWGFSAVDNLVHWYTVTNAGEVHDHRGHFDATGGQLSVDLPTDGKVFSEVITFKRKGKALDMSWVTTLGGTLRERGELALTAK